MRLTFCATFACDEFVTVRFQPMPTVVAENRRTYLKFDTLSFEILALSPLDEADGKEIEIALEKYAIFDKETGLTLYPYKNALTNTLIVPGAELQHSVSPKVTFAVACIVAKQPWEMLFPDTDGEGEQYDDEGGEEGEGEECNEENAAAEEEDAPDDAVEEGEADENAQHGAILRETHRGEAAEEEDEAERAEREKMRQQYRPEVREYIAGARKAFNARAEGEDAPAPPKTWDDVKRAKNALDGQSVDRARTMNDEEAEAEDNGDDDSWGDVMKDAQSFTNNVINKAKQGKQRTVSTQQKKKSKGRRIRKEEEAEQTTASSTSSSDESEEQEESSVSSDFEGNTKKKANCDRFDDMPALEDDKANGSGDKNNDTAAPPGAPNGFDQGASASLHTRKQRGGARSTSSVATSVSSSLSSAPSLGTRKQKSAMPANECLPSEAGSPSRGTRIPVPPTVYRGAPARKTASVAAATQETPVSAALSRQQQQFNRQQLQAKKQKEMREEEQHQQSNSTGDDFIGGYGHAGNMPSGVPIINIDMTQEDDSDEEDDDEDGGEGEDGEVQQKDASQHAVLGRAAHDPQTGFASALSSDAKLASSQPSQTKQQATPLLTQAKGELKDMAEYRRRLAQVRAQDAQGRNAVNVLDATASIDAKNQDAKTSNNDSNSSNRDALAQHPARFALPDTKGLMQNAGGGAGGAFAGLINVEQLSEKDATVFMPTNLDVDPETGRVLRRLDDNLLGLSAKDAKAAQKRRRAKAAVGLDAIDASRRTTTSIATGDAKRDIQRKQAAVVALTAPPPLAAVDHEIEFINNYLRGEGRLCPTQEVWDVILNYVRERSSLQKDEETGDEWVMRPPMLPLEEFEMMAKGHQSPFISVQPAAQTARSNNVQAQRPPTSSSAPASSPSAALPASSAAPPSGATTTPKLTIAPAATTETAGNSSSKPFDANAVLFQGAAPSKYAKETPQEATDRLAREMKQFGMNPSLIQSAVQTSKYRDSTGEEEIVNNFPQSIDEIKHLTRTFQSKKQEKKEQEPQKNQEKKVQDAQPPKEQENKKSASETQPLSPSSQPFHPSPFAASSSSPSSSSTSSPSSASSSSGNRVQCVDPSENNAVTILSPASPCRIVSTASNAVVLNDLFEMHVLLNRQFAAFGMQLSEMSRLNQRLTQMMIAQMK